jgi:glycosyltransferase involved in cell wall biosynthesis
MSAQHLPNRVLLTTDAVGGVWVYAMELALILSQLTVEVVLVVLGPRVSSAQAAEAAALPGVMLAETGLPLDWMAASREVLDRTAAALAVLAREYEVELIQLHSPAWAASCPWPAPVIAVTHSCVGTWWRAVRGDGPLPADFAWRIAAVRAGLLAADAVIAPTQAFAGLTRQVYGLHRPIQVVHNARSATTLAFGFRAGVLAAGRLWDEAKNIATLDAAAAMLPGVPVAAAGPLRGPHGAAVSLAAITALGALDARSMAAAMASARIFASPSVYEPFGLAVLEAAQAGLPLVLADIPTFRELWEGAAMFLPPTAPAAWSEALRRLHERPLECQERGERARKRAARYGIGQFTASMCDHYRRALIGPRWRHERVAL